MKGEATMTKLDAALKILSDALLDAAGERARDVAREEIRRAQADRADEEWISQEEAGRRAGVDPRTIRDWGRRGYLGELGHRSRVNAERLRRHLAGVRLEEELPEPESTATPEARALAVSVLRGIGG